MHRTIVPEPIMLTYEDYAAIPNDGKRYEVLDGDLYMSPSPMTRHQRIVGRIYAALDRFVREKQLGEVFVAPYDVVLSKHNIVQPDVIFVSSRQSQIVTERNIQGVPDLHVEVLSPSNVPYDTRDKRSVYARCGVPNYWIIDPDNRRLTELVLSNAAYGTSSELSGDAVFEPALFPGLRLKLSELWS